MLDHRVAHMMKLLGDPVRGLNVILRDSLNDWRDGTLEAPIIGMCYTIASL